MPVFQMLQQHDLASKRHSSLNELTMQSRLMTEDENKVGKKSEWFRVNLTGTFPLSTHACYALFSLLIYRPSV